LNPKRQALDLAFPPGWISGQKKAAANGLPRLKFQSRGPYGPGGGQTSLPLRDHHQRPIETL